jgi:thiol-disulfide isomerase/thioredoxin
LIRKALPLLLLLLVVPATLLQAAQTFTFTVIGIDCAGCEKPIVNALRKLDGVKNPRLDWKQGLATVELPDVFDKAKLRNAMTELGFEAVFPGEKRAEFDPLPEDVRKTLDIITYRDGRKIDAKKLLASGKVTILDFYGEWCGPCHLLDSRLQHLQAKNRNFAVRRIDIGKWDNAAAAQLTHEFGAEGLPYVRIYDANGKFVTALTGGMWDQILAALTKAGLTL